MTKRNYMWDNMKGFLILTVVIGHFINSFDFPATVANLTYHWIHSFHMPAFLFVTGYLAKGYCKNGVVKFNKTLYLLGYYVAFQVLYYIIFTVMGRDLTFTLFDPYRGLWYLLSMVTYYLMIPIFERIRPIIALPVIIFIGIFAGCEKDAGDFMALSRTLVFAPFFLAGYYTPEKAIEKIRNFKLRIPTGLILMAISVAIWYFADEIFPPELLRKNGTINSGLFAGNKGYRIMKLTNNEGVILRIVQYIISGLMTMGLIMVTPNCKGIGAHVGRNSLAVYLFHLPINIIMIYSATIQTFVIDNTTKSLFIIGAALAVTLILSLKPFSYPFLWIRKLVDAVLSLKQNTAKND